MEVIAWSQNLTAEAAAAEGVRRVEKDELFARPTWSRSTWCSATAPAAWSRRASSG